MSEMAIICSSVWRLFNVLSLLMLWHVVGVFYGTYSFQINCEIKWRQPENLLDESCNSNFTKTYWSKCLDLQYLPKNLAFKRLECLHIYWYNNRTVTLCYRRYMTVPHFEVYLKTVLYSFVLCVIFISIKVFETV